MNAVDVEGLPVLCLHLVWTWCCECLQAKPSQLPRTLHYCSSPGQRLPTESITIALG